VTSVETEKSFDIFFGRTQKMHLNMQKSSFFAENEGKKGMLDGYLFGAHKTKNKVTHRVALFFSSRTDQNHTT
jgi:hypothetical protein